MLMLGIIEMILCHPRRIYDSQNTRRLERGAAKKKKSIQRFSMLWKTFFPIFTFDLDLFPMCAWTELSVKPRVNHRHSSNVKLQLFRRKAGNFFSKNPWRDYIHWALLHKKNKNFSFYFLHSIQWNSWIMVWLEGVFNIAFLIRDCNNGDLRFNKRKQLHFIFR